VSTVIRELVTKFGFDVDEQKLDGLDAALNDVKGTLGAMAAAGTAASGILFGLAQQTASYADDSIKAAERIGLTVEERQALDFALGISGTSMEQQRASFVRLARTASDANEGLSTATRAFDRIGVSVTDATGELKPMETLIRDVADGLSQMENETLRTATAQELFGRRGTDLLQFLEGGAAGINALTEEAMGLGAVISTDAAEGAETFNDEMLRLRTVIRGVKQLIGLELIPELTELVTRMKDWFLANREVISGGILEFLRIFAERARAMVRFVWRIVNVFWRLVEASGGLEANLERLKILLVVMTTRVLVSFVIALWQAFTAATFVGGAFSIAAAKAWLLNLAIAAIPFAIAGIIVAIGYLVDDFNRFLNGQDSLIGALAEKWVGLGGTVGGIGQFFLDLRDDGEIAMELLADSVSFTVERIQGWFERMGLRVKLVFAEMKQSALDAENAIARALGLDTHTDNVLNANGDIATDAIRRQLEASQAAAEHAISNRTRDRILLAEELRIRQGEERNSLTSVESTTTIGEINVNGGNGSPSEIATATVQAIDNGSERQRRETARQLGLAGAQ